MRQIETLLPVVLLLATPLGHARLPGSQATPARTTTTTQTAEASADSLVNQNHIICADQWLSLIDGIGGSEERATEFRLLMSIKCGEKAKRGLFFGEVRPGDPGAQAKGAVDLLLEVYPRVKTEDGKQRVREMISMVRSRPDYPVEPMAQNADASPTSR